MLVAFTAVAWNINIYCLALSNFCSHHVILDVETNYCVGRKCTIGVLIDIGLQFCCVHLVCKMH